MKEDVILIEVNLPSGQRLFPGFMLGSKEDNNKSFNDVFDRIKITLKEQGIL